MTDEIHSEPARDMACDGSDISVLDEDGALLFTGCPVEVQRYLDDHCLTPNLDCELVYDLTGFTVGLV